MSAHDSVKMDFFEIGDKTSLICADPSMVDSIRISLRDLGFKFHLAETAEMAIDRIRYTHYDCIVIYENFAGSSLRSNAVLNYIAPLPMADRRLSFVCLIGPTFKTMDAMQAFAHSVHMVVDPADLSTLTAIMKKGLTEFEVTYHVFRNAQERRESR